jgi:hypothetical protein
MYGGKKLVIIASSPDEKLLLSSPNSLFLLFGVAADVILVTDGLTAIGPLGPVIMGLAFARYFPKPGKLALDKIVNSSSGLTTTLLYFSDQ